MFLYLLILFISFNLSKGAAAPPMSDEEEVSPLATKGLKFEPISESNIICKNIRSCGLMSIDKDKPVSLQEIDIQAEVYGFFADVKTKLTYKNKNEDPLEVNFVFPLDVSSALYDMKSHCDKTIVGKIFEKNEAKKKYDQAIADGKQASLVTEDDRHSDVLTMKLGNIKPGQECWVEFSFVQELESIQKEAKLRFIYPIILGERYTPNSMDGPDVTATTPKRNPEDIPYKFNFKVTVQEPEKVTITPVGGNLMYDVSGNTIQVQEGQVIAENFGAIISHQAPLKPHAVIEAGSSGAPLPAPAGDAEYDFTSFLDDTVVMINFLPDVSQIPLEKDQEYIIIVDRSGSMSGPRIEKAREAIAGFIDLLPDTEGCVFNVISFGSEFEYMYNEVQKCSEKAEEAKSAVQKFDADLGGTEILPVLEKLFKTPSSKNQRQIFLLTDGQVSNTADVIKLAEKNAQKNRFYTFGIGQGASTELVKGISKNGGKYKMLRDDDELALEVQNALEYCQSVFFWDMQLQLSLKDGLKSQIISMDDTISTDPFQVYIVLFGEVIEPSDVDVLGNAILLAKTWEKSESGKWEESSKTFDMKLEIDQSNTHPSLPMHRMAAKKLILDLSTSDKLKQNSWEDKKYTATGQKVLVISKATNVISPVTSFLAIDPDSDVKGDLVTEDIPSIAEGWNNAGAVARGGRIPFMPGPMPIAYSMSSMPMMDASPSVMYGGGPMPRHADRRKYAPVPKSLMPSGGDKYSPVPKSFMPSGGGAPPTMPGTAGGYGGYGYGSKNNNGNSFGNGIIAPPPMPNLPAVAPPVIVPAPAPTPENSNALSFNLEEENKFCYHYKSSSGVDSVLGVNPMDQDVSSNEDCADIVSNEEECGGVWYAYNAEKQLCECVNKNVDGGRCRAKSAPGWNVYKIKKAKIIMLQKTNRGEQVATVADGQETNYVLKFFKQSLHDEFFWTFVISSLFIFTLGFAYYLRNHSSIRKSRNLNENLMMGDATYEC